MPLDLARLRAETPGVARVVHLDNAGAALPPAAVVDAVRSYYDEEVHRGGYATAERRRDELEGTYDALASLVGAGRHEIAITDNATRAWDLVFYSLSFAEGDRILTTTSEYAANYIAYLQVARRTGAVVEVVPDTPEGDIDVAALDAMIDGARLVSLNHVPTNGGLVNPVAEVGAVARAAGVPFLLDACQSVGQLPVDVTEIGCDFMSATSRKFLRGPRGMGFLYVGESWLERLEPVMLDLHGARWLPGDSYELRPDARRFEVWEQNLAAKAGLRAAVEYATAIGGEAAWERIRTLGERLRALLAGVPGVVVRDRGTVRGGIVTFTVDFATPRDVQLALRARDINVSTVTPWSARRDMDGRGLAGLVRASVHYYNTESELETMVDALGDLAAASQRSTG